MKRSGPIKRKTPLKRTPIARSKRKGLDESIRAVVFLRDKGCKGSASIPLLSCWGRLDPHHVLRKSQGGQDSPENLVTLCRAHHDWVHANPEASRQLGLLKRPQPKDQLNDHDNDH